MWIRPESKYWPEPSLHHFNEMNEFFSAGGLFVPFVPIHLRELMMQFPHSQHWSSSNEVNLNDLDHLLLHKENLIDYVRPSRGDFFLTGTGMGRWASRGIICRYGPLLVAQKSWWELGKKDEHHDAVVLSHFNECTTAWNATAAALQNYAHQEIRVVLLYSNTHRDSCSQIWLKDPNHFVETDETDRWSFVSPKLREHLGGYIPGETPVPWDIIESGQKESFESRLQKLVDGPDEIVAIAAKHLLSVPRHWTWAYDHLPDLFSE
jgi:hypothetical protein